jgi:hypothetical protein
MSKKPKGGTDVRLEKIDGEWAVFVVEGGKTIQKMFETQRFAKSFADGQRLRLGLSVEPDLQN